MAGRVNSQPISATFRYIRRPKIDFRRRIRLGIGIFAAEIAERPPVASGAWEPGRPVVGVKMAEKGEGVARMTGLEPATSGVTGRRSNQLSYIRTTAPTGVTPGGRRRKSEGRLIGPVAPPVKRLRHRCRKALFENDSQPFAVFETRGGLVYQGPIQQGLPPQ